MMSYTEAINLVEDYLKELAKRGLRIPLAILHGPWVTGEAYIMEPNESPPLDVVVINEEGVNERVQAEHNGYRLNVELVDFNTLLERVRNLDIGLIEAIISGIFVRKNDEYFIKLTDTLNDVMTKRRLRWDPETDQWIHD